MLDFFSMGHDSQAQLKRNVYALLRMWGLTPSAASIACGQRGSWISEVFRKDRRSISLSRLDALAEYLGIEPAVLIGEGGLPPVESPEKKS
jgi:hypothetical protein